MNQVVCEKSVWVELLAFDVNEADLGVGTYIQTLGFTPKAVFLLMGAPDIVLQHEGLEEDALFPADLCSRDGQPGNETRQRQVWSRFLLRELISRLHQADCEVYLSQFTNYLHDRFHQEWLHDRPDGKIVLTTQGRSAALWVLARLDDGTYLQDFFAAQLERVCQDYGFDGWHGADGYGPAVAPLHVADCSDDMIRQFTIWGKLDLPEVVTAPSLDLPENLQRRMDWIWRYKRKEWSDFYCDRWAEFWRLISTALHASGRKAFINSAWTRDPFQSMYRYGIDYKKIVEAGVDGIVVETVAGSLMLQNIERDFHYDYLAMLLLIRAYVPKTKLLFLHPVKDVNENWDLLRHAPATLEREIYALANVFHTDSAGRPTRSVDGFVACLADGISNQEWQWLDERWQLAFEAMPQRVLGATLVWSDSAFHRHANEYASQREWSAHFIAYRLMECGAPLQSSIDIRSAGQAPGPLLIPQADLLPAEERQLLLECGLPLIAFGTSFNDWPGTGYECADTISDNPLRCRLYNTSKWPRPHEPLPPATEEENRVPADLPGLAEPEGFRDEQYYLPVTAGFWARCAELVQTVSGAFRVENAAEAKVGVMLTEQSAGVYRIAAKSSELVYIRPRIDIGRPIRAIKVRTRFPVTAIEFEGTSFTLVVPPRGIVVADIYTDDEVL